MSFDYSKITIYQDNTKCPQTIKLNSRLLSLYKKWFFVMQNKGLNNLGNLTIGKHKLIEMQLLTAFDSYVKNQVKIMTFGKEANTNKGNVTVFNEDYQKDIYYSYDYAIAHRYDEKVNIPAKDAPNTFYLKARKIISGICLDNYNLNEDFVLSILNNNLNKTSLSGKYTPCSHNTKNNIFKNYDLDDIVYSKFDNEDLNANIFLHEINILEPTHIIFLCGKGYDEHIKRAFGSHFLNILLEHNKNLSVKNPCGDIFDISYKDLGLQNYAHDRIKIMQTIHPSAHIGDKRKEYHDKLKYFCQ